MTAKIDKLREFKGADQLAHLYVDGNDEVRDKHIEDMFNRLYGGQPLDDIFRTNFGVYHKWLTRSDRELPDHFFDNVSVARSWVAQHYGLIHATTFDPDAFEYDADLADKRFMAKLSCRFAPALQTYCYSPTEIGSILLTVVSVYRSMARDYIDSLTS